MAQHLPLRQVLAQVAELVLLAAAAPTGIVASPARQRFHRGLLGLVQEFEHECVSTLLTMISARDEAPPFRGANLATLREKDGMRKLAEARNER